MEVTSVREGGALICKLVGRLDALSPLAVLGRGYALCRRRVDGRLVRSVAEVCPGEAVEVEVGDGLIDCAVGAVRVRTKGLGPVVSERRGE